MKYYLRYLLACAALTFLSGCTQILTATADGPIVEDPGSRSLGSYIDDQIIETKATVNIRKTDPDLENAPFNVHSHNGIVLLTGQVSSQVLKNQAGDAANKLRKVRKVHNELSVGPKPSFWSGVGDGWLETKVDTKLTFSKSLDASRIKVIAEDGVIYLMGIVSQAESEQAAKIASQTDGVKKVVRVFEYY
ncbi:BON domain-containing protein [Spongiibacter sp. KMU-158]|uniref:BON domain-containing protein n=1 Tax=Spongiibacter pelagi TaxID=2760804 RepID=A0A927GWG8_9GAMM|nr:BON domain-containing protein [Spongiibacter pelagi]MBD2859726.1 BON domain-containing protein [Spongiibacter pelagi]